MSVSKNRAKYGYLNYDDIRVRIESGDLDIYDVIYTKDTHETIFITPELDLISMKSKVYCYPDVETAEQELNSSTDTYEGQVVSILFDEVYVGYIVNKNYKGEFYVSPISVDNGEVNYDTLGNKPIINLIGTIDDPVLIESLDDGIYSVKGQYKITEEIETVYLSATNILFMVEKKDDGVYVKKITTSEIIDYVISDSGITISTIATTDYIHSCGFATTIYVDDKIAALDFITKEEVDKYVTDLVIATIDDILDERIEAKIDEKIQPVDDESIFDLFI